MAQTRIMVKNEVKKGQKGNWILCFQYCTYKYEDGKSQDGYRFIWRKNGKLQPARGQARIPSIADIIELTEKAISEGWGNFTD